MTLAKANRSNGNEGTKFGNYSHAARSTNNYGESVIAFAEEGSAAPVTASVTEFSAGRKVKQNYMNSNSKSPHKHGRRHQRHPQGNTIEAQVASPDDLRFRVCRQEGRILVATDPAPDSLCSRMGVRTGDRILGVLVDIKGAADAGTAHPKEVSELLSLASDYPLVVTFEHTGPLIVEPSSQQKAAAPPLRQHRPSPAELALQRHRDRRSVDIADELSTPTEAGAVTIQLPQKRKKQSRAPPPPVDVDSHFAIRDRRKRRRRRRQSSKPTVDRHEWLDKLATALAEAEADETEWQWLPSSAEVVVEEASSSGDESGSEIEFEIAAATANTVAAASAEPTAFEESESVEALRRNFGGSFSDDEPESVGSADGNVRPSVERIFDYYELEEQDVVLEMPPPSAERPVVDSCTQFDSSLSADGKDFCCSLATAASPEGAWESLENRSLAGPTLWQSLPNDQQCVWMQPDDENNTRGDLPDALLFQEAAFVPTADPEAARTATAESDTELATYLSRAARGSASASSSASPVASVQEEPAVEIFLQPSKASSMLATPHHHRWRREDSLVELSRSMALRDVEVATVILLDSEEAAAAAAAAASRPRRRRRANDRETSSFRIDYDEEMDEDDDDRNDEYEDEAASSSGRSTAHEDCIEAEAADDRRALGRDRLSWEIDALCAGAGHQID